MNQVKKIACSYSTHGPNLVNLYLDTENNEVLLKKTKRKVNTQDRHHKRKLSCRNRNQPSIIVLIIDQAFEMLWINWNLLGLATRYDWIKYEDANLFLRTSVSNPKPKIFCMVTQIKYLKSEESYDNLCHQ